MIFSKLLEKTAKVVFADFSYNLQFKQGPYRSTQTRVAGVGSKSIRKIGALINGTESCNTWMFWYY